MIKYNPEAVAKFIQKFEGFDTNPYKDSAGIYTIGIGTIKYANGKRVTATDKPITYEQAVNELAFYCKGIIDVLNRVILADLNENQTTAIISLCYNIGENNFAESTLCKLINNNSTDSIIILNSFIVWNKVRDPKTKQLVVSSGLTKRRKIEAELYLT